jgi:hypothetical protein
MIAMVRSVLEDTRCYRAYRAARRGRREARALAAWEEAGRPIPPPSAVKQCIVRDFARRFRLRTLVETGTYLGDMVDAMRHSFDRIVSIELDPALHERARARFAGRGRVKLLQGDSGRVLPEVLRTLREPALFWLDGHYSGGCTARGDKDTPVVAECAAVLAHPVAGHVLLIDDARCFDGSHDYPTVEELRRLVGGGGDVAFDVAADMIRVHRRAA